MVILSYEMILLLFFCHCIRTAFARNDVWARGAILITLTFVAAFAEQTHKIYSCIMQSWENKIQLCQSLPPFAGTFATIHQKATFALLSRIFRAQGLNFRQRYHFSCCSTADGYDEIGWTTKSANSAVKPSSALKFGLVGSTNGKTWQNNFVFTWNQSIFVMLSLFGNLYVLF